jgi:hypothetical protein
MNPISKKLISLFLVFSLMMLSANLYAKERRGAKLIITKKDGQQISGELITVKPNSLLLLDTKGKDMSVYVADIEVIRIEKKSGFWKGAGTGALIGVGTGALIGFLDGDDSSGLFRFTAGQKAIIIGIAFGALGLLIGGIVELASKGEKTIQFENMTDLEIQETLDRLCKKARIRDYR